MRQETNSHEKLLSSKVLLTICYSLTAALIMALLILLVIWISTSRDQDSPLASAPDYAVAEKKIWSVEPMPDAKAFLYAETADFVQDVQYVTPPAETLGTQNISLRLQLADGTLRTENAILNVQESVLYLELGTDATPATLLGAEHTEAVFTPPLSDFHATGTYPVDVSLVTGTYPFTLIVQDTLPPEAVLNEELSFATNQEVTVKDFLKSYSDATEVKVRFSEEPDTTTNGTKTTQIILTDGAGNVRTLDVTYTVSGDDAAPVFEGCVDLTTLVGVPLSYTHNVKAIDALDGEVSVTAAEQDGLDLKTAGDYTITYTASDAAGNTATQTVILHVLPKDADLSQIDENSYMLMGYYITDEILADAENMSEKDRAYKCYRYVQDHMYFVDNNNEVDCETEWMYPAALAIRQKYGDCRNYYGFSRLLLTCAGFENMMVFHPANHSGADRHWWNLVKIDGEWYHFDTTPRVGRSNFFMLTDAQMDSYSAANGNCFARDKSLYPKTP